jgi:hypothetical protein
LKYFERYKLKNCIPTKYADKSLALAYNLLFRAAYAHSADNYKFIILSGACIPLKSFDYVYDKLTNDNYGYFNVCPQEQCFPNCDKLLKVLDQKYISKAHNWFIINRKLVESLCFDKDDVIKKAFNIYAPEEYYYYTFIKILNLEDEIITTPNVSNDATTFTNWEGTKYKYPSTKENKNYTSISSDELEYLLNSECLFGRKFNRECMRSLCNKKYIDTISGKQQKLAS